MARSSEYRSTGIDPIVLAWTGCVIGLTGIGVAILWLLGVNLQTLSPTSPNAAAALGAIELTAYAPTLAALLVSGLLPGAGGLRRLLRPVLWWRVGIGWYGLAVIGPIMFVLAADSIHMVRGGAAPEQWLAIPSGFAVAFLIGSLIAGAFGEEVGWRGMAQPRLQTTYGALVAALIVGVLWACWHDWTLIGPGGAAGQTLGGVGLTFVRLAALSILYAWLYNSTGGSLLIVMVAHAGYDFANALVGTPRGTDLSPIIVATYAIAAVIVVILTGARWLSREHRYPTNDPALAGAGGTRKS